VNTNYLFLLLPDLMDWQFFVSQQRIKFLQIIPPGSFFLRDVSYLINRRRKSSEIAQAEGRNMIALTGSHAKTGRRTIDKCAGQRADRGDGLNMAYKCTPTNKCLGA